jgi:hypothetical protein
MNSRTVHSCEQTNLLFLPTVAPTIPPTYYRRLRSSCCDNEVHGLMGRDAVYSYQALPMQWRRIHSDQYWRGPQIEPLHEYLLPLPIIRHNFPQSIKMAVYRTVKFSILYISTRWRCHQLHVPVALPQKRN